MISVILKTVPFYLFENLGQHSKLQHFITTREGGVSEGIYSSLNLSLRVNDNASNVLRNRNIVAQTFGIETAKLIFPGQCHDNMVAIVDNQVLSMTVADQSDYLNGVDALVTDVRNICICILTADCASILLYDPVHHAAGIAHAGWKGTVKKIAAKTISKMISTYGSDPKDMVAAIGPCISADSFEVGEEVAEIFEDTFDRNNDIVIRRPEWPKPHVDIIAANISTLTQCGVERANIETSGICTYQHPDLFFSARRNAGGRFASGMMLI